MHSFVYGLMAIVCLVFGGFSINFAAISYKEKHWLMFVWDILTLLLNLVVTVLCLFVVFR